MVFLPPQWVPELPFDPPDSISISEFMLDEQYGRYPLRHARQPFTCGLTGFGYSALEVRDRVDKLARALSKELGWRPNEGTEWDKVIGIFSVNTVGTSYLYKAIMWGGRLMAWKHRLTLYRCRGPFIAYLESRRQQTHLTRGPNWSIS